MDSGDRLRAELGSAMRGAEAGLATADRLCRGCVEFLEVDGAAISIMGGGTTRGTFGSSGDLSRRLEEFQFTFGEGPCMDAVTGARPVLVSDLDQPGEAVRWPAYAPAVLEAGVHAVFSLPICISAVAVGALDLFRAAPGPLSGPALTGGLLAARLAALPLLELMRADMDSAALNEGDPWEQLASLERVEVYQATGMIMARLRVGTTEALARLRAHAYAYGLTASETAWQIVTRRLVLERDEPWWTPGGEGAPP